MIKNEKEYKITKRKISECNVAIDGINNNPEKDPVKKILLITSLEVFRNDMQDEILAYEKLKSDKKNFLKERQISELPSLLTDYKIRSGLTQKEFAKKLGVKEQQLQRYEASSFKSVTFKNLLKYFDILGLEIRVKQTRFTRTNKKTAKKKKPA
jgi:ribosome-binding protein aMBF1 (putative translation factor)